MEHKTVSLIKTHRICSTVDLSPHQRCAAQGGGLPRVLTRPADAFLPLTSKRGSHCSVCASVCVVTFEDPLISDGDGVNAELLISVFQTVPHKPQTWMYTQQIHITDSALDTHTHTQSKYTGASSVPPEAEPG